MNTSPANARFISALQELLGAETLLTDPSDCWPYGYDNSRRQALPDAVAFATDSAQIATIVKLCNQHRVPLVARGRGTGTTGATVPVGGGLVLSLERMDRILKIDPDNRTARVEPGVTNGQLQQAIAEYGFFWPPDPTSAAVCTIGGNLAYNSAGPRAVKYGTPRENTLGLHAVTGNGDPIRTGVCTTKGVVGYDLTRLLIGSEGTLAIITEALLKLTPLAGSRRTLQATYGTIHAAARAVAAIMAQPVTPCALEFMDGAAIDMVRTYSDLSLDPRIGAMLMIEVDGAPACIDQAVEAVRAAAQVPGALAIEIAAEQADIDRLWRTRKALSPSLRKVAPMKINEDVVVPVSRIPDLIGGLDQLSKQHQITIINFGHAGNGNIHVNLLFDPADHAQTERANACLDAVFNLVLSLDGTLSGEHGVGLAKREFIAREIDPITLNLMRAIKNQFDPTNILNPGKVFPDPPA